MFVSLFSEKNWLAESIAPRVKGTHDWQRVAVAVQAPPTAVAAMVDSGLSQSKGTAWS